MYFAVDDSSILYGAKYMAVNEAIKEAIWPHGLIDDLGIEQKHVVVFCDS